MLSILPWSVPNKQTWKQPISQDSKIWQVGYIALIEKKFGEELLLPEGNDEDGEVCAAVEAQHLFLGHVDIVSEIIFFSSYDSVFLDHYKKQTFKNQMQKHRF